MPGVWTAKEDWSTGELAPSWQGRISSPEYKSGSALLYNILPREGGGWRRRPGTRWIATLPAGIAGNTRQVPFTAQNGHPFELLIAVVSTVPTIYVYDALSHALVATVTSSVPAYANGDIPCINWGQQGGQTWLFMSGLGAATTAGLTPAYISNAAADGSGAWSCTAPSFTGAPSGFMAASGWPGCGEFYAGRLWMSGCPISPLAMLATQLFVSTGNYTTLTISGIAGNAITDGIYYLNSNMNARTISWMLASQALLAATDKGVWMEYPESYPTGATFGLKQSASYGSLPNTRGVQVTNVVLHLGAESKSFRSLTLSLYRGYYADENKSVHANHLFSKLATDFCVILRPEPQAWIMMADGSLVVATVKQEDTGFLVKSVCGFSQQHLGGGGSVQSLCEHTSTYWDEVWFVVNRGGVLTLEYLYLDDIFSTTQAASFYVDCGVTLTGPGTTFNLAAGLATVLNGQSCAGFGDGKVMPQVAPSAGSFAYAISVTTLQFGFPMASVWQDVRPSLPVRAGVGAQGLIKQLNKSIMRVYNSMGGWIGQTLPASYFIPQTTLADFWPTFQTFNVQKYGAAPQMVSGDIPFEHSEGAARDGQVCIVVCDPVPFNLIGIFNRYGDTIEDAA